MKKRLFENYVTTIVGLIMLGAATYAWITEFRSTEECAIVAGWAFMFLRSKDSLIGLSKDGKGNEK